MTRVTYLASALIAISCCAVAEAQLMNPAGKQKMYDVPLSLDPAPPAIEGVDVRQVVEFFRGRGYRDLQADCFYCRQSGTYEWFGLSSKHTGVTTIDSYTGKNDLTGISFQFTGFTESRPSQTPENMPAVIADVAEEAQIACADESQKKQLAELIKDRATKLIYGNKGRVMPDGTTIFMEDFAVLGKLHVHIQNTKQDEVAQSHLDITAARTKTWTSGKFSVTASYLSHDSKQVRLVKADGSEIAVPLTKLSADDKTWLAKLLDYETRGRGLLEDAPEQGVAKRGDKSQPKGGQPQWLNTTYNNTLRHIKGKEWAEFDNSTGARGLGFVETGRTRAYLELFCPERKQKFRIFADHSEWMKDGKWERVANGRWAN